MAKIKDEDGVWRTIGGRRIFIANGQSLSDAMKSSGKFKKSKESKGVDTKTEPKKTSDKTETKGLSEEERAKKIEELEKKKQEVQGFLQRGEIQEEINMLKDNFTGTKEEYREYVEKEQERRMKEYEKEKEERLKLYKSQNNNEDDYKMAHRPTETGITADNLLKKGNEVESPKDIYEHPEYYSIDQKFIKETMQQLNKVRNNEDAEITIYRATTGNSINDGDWVTLSKNYAEHHNESQLDGKGKVLEMKVKARDVQFAGDALEEWGYFPKKKAGNVYLKAYNEYKKEHPNSKISFTDFKKNIYE